MSRIRSSVLSPKTIPAAVFIAVVLVGQMALATQDKYTVAVPGGLSFAEFKGYEQWQIISMSHSGNVLAAILGNPTMIDAYKAGLPGNGEPFPDGAKMAKIHWVPTTMDDAPGQPTVPGTLHGQGQQEVRGQRRLATPSLITTRLPTRSVPPMRKTRRHKRTTPSAASRATRSCRRKTTSSRRTRSGNRHRSYWERS
jgi:hypothetical protein